MSVAAEEFARMQRHRHGPGWRWQRAEALAAGAAPRRAGPEDRLLLEACAYFRLRKGEPEGEGRAAQAFPQVAVAEALAQDGAARAALKVLVVGGCPPCEIAERLRVDAGAVAAWEGLFFDARPARGATSWILQEVIRPEQERGDAHLASQLKFACAGGPAAARAVLDAESRVSLRDGQTLFDQKIRLHLKFDQAAGLPLVTGREKLFFIKLHADLMHREQRLRLAERRLEQRSEEALRKQRLAEGRLELRRRREEERAAREEAGRARKRDGQRTRNLQRRPEAPARARARQEREEAARAHAAGSALGHLRWAYSGGALATARSGGSPGLTQEGAEQSCPLPEGPDDSAVGESAVREAGTDEPPVDTFAPVRVEPIVTLGGPAVESGGSVASKNPGHRR